MNEEFDKLIVYNLDIFHNFFEKENSLIVNNYVKIL